MLNREEPGSNILLVGKLKEEKRMRPASSIRLGENGWHRSPSISESPLASSPVGVPSSGRTDRGAPGEGDTDKQYFELFQKNLSDSLDALDSEIAVVAYGGKDTLKDTLLVQFVLSSFDNVYVTYDLDAHEEAKSALARLGLKETQNFLPLGVAKPGKECIEGLLPDRILASVNGRETNLVMALGDSKRRREAKEKLKKLYLEELGNTLTTKKGARGIRQGHQSDQLQVPKITDLSTRE